MKNPNQWTMDERKLSKINLRSGNATADQSLSDYG
jgi:hypothetical protein